MGYRIGRIFTAALLIMMSSVVESRGECVGSSVKIDDAGRKFAVILPAGSGMEAQSFDDIGCAVLSRNGECASRQSMFDTNAVVYDYQTAERLPAEKAYFVLRTGITTPQGYGIVAFKDKAEAVRFSSGHGNGKVVKWFELVDEPLK
jgi:hypothetical protein